ncbi:MAG: cysteine desulfurase NifS [Omnitrophica bacterium RIFCSPLOWO2_01_FULL_50_24]|nr:MAG: cysteine desulfurase NifS [Omnitrophica bacterium RIFCSPLOWO2_01_FULL_50_24]
MIYLDNNATTKVAPEVREAMEPFYSETFGNPSSLHSFGKEVRRCVEEARDDVARLMGAAHGREIVFTSGGTESNNTAICSALKSVPSRKTIVTTEVEHSSVRVLVQRLGTEGYHVISVNVTPTGALDLNALENALTGDVAMASIMWANNETGVLFDLEQVAQIVKQKGILLHVDGVQAVGKIPVDLARVPIDFLSFSAHKFHGPKGAGALYVRDRTPFYPHLVGGRQERDRRAGTENVAGIIGLSRALELAVSHVKTDATRVASLRDRLESALASQIAESFVNGKSESRIPNTTNITIPGIESETFLIRLSERGIAASSGSACLTGAVEPSHVLAAMGRSRQEALGSVRFSLSRYTTSEDIDFTIGVVPKLVRELREFNQTGTVV